MLLAPAAFGQSFASKTDYPTGLSQPRSIVSGDLDGDGRLDLVLGGVGAISVLKAQGAAGAFGSPVAYSVGGTESDVVAVADLNGDGRLDIVTTNFTGNQTIVFLNPAATPGTFGAGVAYTTGGTNPLPVGVADMNGDGLPDIVVANRNEATVGILLNSMTTPGTFGAATTYSYGFGVTYGLRLGDLNNDGRPDVAVTLQSSNQVGVLLNSATTPGTLGTAVAYPVNGSVPDEVRLADVNGDGRLDIITANTGGSGSVSVLLASGAPGSFTAGVNYPGGGGNVAVTLGDVTGDGLTDIVTPTGQSGTSVNVLPGQGNGTFGAAVSFPIGAAFHYGVELGDLNGDGRLDIAVPNGGANTVSILLNSGTYAALALTSVNPNSGPVGTVVTLTGTALTGATAVSFNGTAATSFTVNSSTQITATVPTGATTGLLTVTTSAGTSNGLVFTVTVAPADLVINTPGQSIPAGTYNTITVNSGGTGTLAGNVTVNTRVTVNSGGTLNDGCNNIVGAGSFTLAAGGTLGICNAAGITLSGAQGAIQSTGPRSFSTDASYVYNGTAAQTTGNGLPGQVRNLSTTNANAVTLSAATSVAQVLTVAGAGNLATAGNALTLLSRNTGTAVVVNSSTGVVVGNATVQRYIDPSLNPGLGYRHYSAPVANTTVADLATTGFTPEVSQASTYNTSATPGTTTPFPTVFGYDQSRVTLPNAYDPFNRGFVVPASPATPLAVGQGYSVSIAADQLVDFVGTLNNGTQSLALNRVAGNADAGWQLLGNPYPAPLDYSRVAPADRANLDAAIYVYSSTGQYAGQYRSYANGVGGNPVLPVGQGFFARVSSGQTSGSLTFRNSQRLTSPDSTAFQRPAADPRPLVQLDLRGSNGLADGFYLYAETGATAAFDSQLDAVKLPNPTGLNLSSRAASGEELAIDGRPAFTAATALALSVGVPTAGSYTLTAATLRNLPAGLDAYLSDAQTGQTVNLRTQPAYTFSVTAAQATALLTGRFTLRFSATVLASKAALAAAQVSLYPNPAHNTFSVQVPAIAGASAVQVELLNPLGQVVRRQSAALPAAGTTLQVEATGLAAGVYTLRLQAGTSILAKRVVLY
ncbi:FG-GAP-like repeat-containing protein [Hymenobacter rubripertinctus]|nr:FG-GAP-like repeat-containing protein [Hymenobacter rubripertinctus]